MKKTLYCAFSAFIFYKPRKNLAGCFSKAPFEPSGKKKFEIGGVKNFSLSEGASPSSRNSAAGCKRPRKGQGAKKNGNR